MDERIRILRVLRVAGDADRDGGADRVARRLDVVELVCDRTADPLGDLHRLLGRRLRQEDRELLAAEAGRNVVLPQLGAEDLGDALQDGVAGEMAVGVVDLAEQIEVGHDQRERPLEALCAPELLRERGREVARVEQARLRIDASLRLQLRHRERSVDQQQRRDRERDEPGVARPERREDDAQRGEDELGRERLVREELSHRMAVDQADHGRDQRRVEHDEDDGGGGAREGEADVVGGDEVVRTGDDVCRPPRRHRRDREDEDVGGLHVPRPAAAQPLGNVLDQRNQGEQRRLYEQCRRDQEDAGRVVALVAGRSHDEELRHRNTDGENDELEPIARVPVELGEERHRDGERGSADEQKVGERLRRQLRAALDTADALDRIFEWNRAHSARPMPFMPRVSFDAAENRKQLIRPDRPVRRVCRRWGRGIPRSRHDLEFPRKGESGPASRPARCLTALREGKCRG